jgi:hypothetical protein
MAKRENATAEQVAEYMMELYHKGNNRLDQREAAISVAIEFGDEFATQSSASNATLSAAVLKAFKEQSGPGVVFDNHYKCWRPREPDEDQTSRKAKPAPKKPRR